MTTVFVRASRRAKAYVRTARAKSIIKKIDTERKMYGNVWQPGAGKSHLIKRVRSLNKRRAVAERALYRGHSKK